jgi:hypothetical protein
LKELKICKEIRAIAIVDDIPATCIDCDKNGIKVLYFTYLLYLNGSPRVFFLIIKTHISGMLDVVACILC